MDYIYGCIIFFTQISKEQYVLVLMFYNVLSRNSEQKITSVPIFCYK